VTGRKVVLFYTCSVQWNEPQVGRASVEVLEHNEITVFAPEFRCCGMPALDGGDVPRATSWAEHNIKILKPYIDAGCDIVSPGPTCSFMMKKEWKDYLGTTAAEAVAAKSFDIMEYLWNFRKAKLLKDDFEGLGEIGYHVPCHLKVQKIGFRSKDLLSKIPDTKVKLVDKCSCMDGTWGMKTEYYELSKKGAAPLLSALTENKPPTLASDCLIAKLQIEEGTNQKVLHPIELLAQAYAKGKKA
jgi:glycerol-3-phosphate dehydrogenase subunit C